jgi:hypothetical protein
MNEVQATRNVLVFNDITVGKHRELYRLEVYIDPNDEKIVKAIKGDWFALYDVENMTRSIKDFGVEALQRCYLPHIFEIFEAMVHECRHGSSFHGSLLQRWVVRSKALQAVSERYDMFKQNAHNMPLFNNDISTFTGNESSRFVIEAQTITDTSHEIIGLIDYQFGYGTRVKFSVPRNLYQVILSPSLEPSDDSVSLSYEGSPKNLQATVLETRVK